MGMVCRRWLLHAQALLLLLTGLVVFLPMCQCRRAAPSQYSAHVSYAPSRGRAENGDVYNVDNDGDGRREPVYVRGYYRKDGSYVRSHYRARSRR